MKSLFFLGFSLLAGAAFCVGVSGAGEVGEDGRWQLEQALPGGGVSVLPEAGRNITAAYLAGDVQRRPLVVEYNKDATEVKLHVPEGGGGKAVLEVAEKSTQFVDGRIVLSALDAEVAGGHAKLETHPGNHRIGFWSDIGDVVNWTYGATRPGMYDVEMTYSVAGGGGNEVEIAFGGEKLGCALADTGSWYRYTTVPVGRVYIEKAGPLPVQVRGVKMGGAALMNLKAITLLPATEGAPVVQAADGSVELDARDATVHSTLMQYERNPKKLCLGYWVNPEDWASWVFPIGKPGRFKVEVTQGCGGGQGGSEIEVRVGAEALEFVVEDTGAFQNWKARDIGTVDLGEAGDYRLEVRPRNKAKGAVMDVRRVRLVPVD